MDFNSALGRLLRDGGLRDDFRTDPGRVLAGFGLALQDSRAIESLNFDDLEVQADILLRKRFDLVKRLAPRTCDVAGWSGFRSYSRLCWPPTVEADAAAFCDHTGRPAPLEWKRARFASGVAMCEFHWIRRHAGNPAGVQVLFRCRGTWREWFFEIRL